MKHLSTILITLLLTLSYQAFAQCPTGQTEVTITLSGSDYGDTSWELVNETTNMRVDSFKCGGAATTTFTSCLTNGHQYVFYAYAGYGYGWNGKSVTISLTEDGSVNGCTALSSCIVLGPEIPDNGLYPSPYPFAGCPSIVGGYLGIAHSISDLEGSFTLPIVGCNTVQLSGCMDPASNNYNPCATVDDGSCIYPPTNNECTNATSLIMHDEVDCEFTSLTFENATKSTISHSCTSTTSYESDVWVSFVATSDSAHFDITPAIPSALMLYADACNGTDLGCVSANLATGLTVGKTYYLRLLMRYTSTTSFDICIRKGNIVRPSNDECASAIPLTVNPADNCTYTQATLTHATRNASYDHSCNTRAGSYADIWFSFVAPANGQIMIRPDLFFLGNSGVNYALYAGSCTGTQVACQENTNQDFYRITSLTPGTTYYLKIAARIYTSQGLLNICLSTIPSPPVNDALCNALALTLDGDSITTCNHGATAQTTLSYSGTLCVVAANPVTRDIWYTFNASDSGDVYIYYSQDELNSDSHFRLFESSNDACNGTLNQVGCYDESAGFAVLESYQDGLTAGKKYFLQLDSHRALTTCFNLRIGTNSIIEPPETLPVELTSFEATHIERKHVQLDWITASEINNHGFEIRHSRDGSTFEKIGYVQGNYTTNEENKYDFLHTNAKVGKNYYQLKQYDLDGQFQYSRVISVTIGNVQEGIIIETLAPNPASDFVNLQVVSAQAQDMKVKVINTVGEVVYQDKASLIEGRNQVRLNLENISNGMYFIQMTSARFKASERIVITK